MKWFPSRLASLLFTQSIMNKVPSRFSRTNLRCGHFLFCVCVSWIKSTQCHHQSRCVSSLSNSRWKLRCFNFADLESVFLLNPETMRECEIKTKKTCQCPRICRNFMNLFFIHFLCSCYFLTLGKIRVQSFDFYCIPGTRAIFVFYVIMVSFELLLTFVHHSDLIMIVSCVCNNRND